ncbi:unnamed protein product [Pedinophyceae sp. YPF-701]|nr:unnamed protein product [Pedinophyceae sp. YPF-701]
MEAASPREDGEAQAPAPDFGASGGFLVEIRRDEPYNPSQWSTGRPDSLPTHGHTHEAYIFDPRLPKQDRRPVPLETQTDPIRSRTVGIQIGKVRDGACQATAEDVAPHQLADYDPGSMEAFLDRAVPSTERCLQENLTSTAFQWAAGLLGRDYAATRCTATLNGLKDDNPDGLVVTSISWNCTGNTIAAGYGRTDITGWCPYGGCVCKWNLQREQVEENKPDVRVDVDACLTFVEFHPEMKQVLAGGTFTGELYVWDLSQDDPSRQLVAKSQLSALSHTEPITHLAWRHNPDVGSRHAYQLVSAGSEGRINVWEWNKLAVPLASVDVHHGGHTPGILSMSFERGNDTGFETEFVVGTDGGGVMRCNLDTGGVQGEAMLRNLEPGQTPKLKSVVKSNKYQKHAGPTHAVHLNPHNRNVFLSAGLDGEIKVFSTVQLSPLLTVHPSQHYVVSAQWSPFRKLLLAAGCQDGTLHFYDLSSSPSTPLASVQAALGSRDDANSSRLHVLDVQFNPSLREYLATAQGPEVKIWALGATLSEAGGQRETSMLSQLGVGDANILKKSSIVIS